MAKKLLPDALWAEIARCFHQLPRVRKAGGHGWRTGRR